MWLDGCKETFSRLEERSNLVARLWGGGGGVRAASRATTKLCRGELGMLGNKNTIERKLRFPGWNKVLIKYRMGIRKGSECDIKISLSC